MSGIYREGGGGVFLNVTDLNNTKIRGGRKKHQELISLIERKSEPHLRAVVVVNQYNQTANQNYWH